MLASPKNKVETEKSEESSILDVKPESKARLSAANRKLAFKMGKGNKSQNIDAIRKKSALCDSSIFKKTGGMVKVRPKKRESTVMSTSSLVRFKVSGQKMIN